ncbi:DUF559 domain-containing protein [Hydrogenophaga sp. YM1]|uniref:DUF559 domain-containing protein n=1 Tax=Hydrogenophaga sp. YM1 TaxID=2806262 RepID=UPI001957D586|nr:DUF559 domain-containing protein [Hydrogenophaga sp. YM1]QRR34690.1 DUF559 domain-containing protein [Hydrogenophaga sp. YM1]
MDVFQFREHLVGEYEQFTRIDRKDKGAGGLLLDILCRLTAARAHQGTQGRAPQEHDAELARTAGSTLEQAWLNHVNVHGYRKPDRGQYTIASAKTCADFFYDDLNLAVYIDGPHHETDAQREKDLAIDRALDELGFLVVRFPKEQTRWSDIFKNNTERLYREFFLAAAEAADQLGRDGCVPFQFIVTTTSAPPAEVEKAPYVILELAPGADESLLFKRQLAPELSGFDDAAS